MFNKTKVHMNKIQETSLAKMPIFGAPDKSMDYFMGMVKTFKIINLSLAQIRVFCFEMYKEL